MCHDRLVEIIWRGQVLSRSPPGAYLYPFPESAHPLRLGFAQRLESGDEAKKEKDLEKLPKAVAEERSKLVKQLPCGSMQLVTNKTTRTAVRDDASKVCNSLETENSVIYSVNYILDRYEIPVALTYSKDNKKVLVPIANKAHSKFDPR